MKKLSLTDHLFLMLENKKQPMHVSGVCIFEIPNHDHNFIQRLIEDLQIYHSTPTFPFNQSIYKNLYWKTHKNFKIQHHFRHIVLPNPADIKTLLAYISLEHSRIMDRQKPLWEYHLIEGIAPQYTEGPKRFAIYLKIHHSMADGVAAMRLLQMSLSKDPNAILHTPFWVMPPKYHQKLDLLSPKSSSPITLLKQQLASIKPVYRSLRQRWQDRQLPDFTSSFDAPASILNQPIKSTRYVGAASFDKAYFVELAKHFAVTTNDVILAVCSGALRTYLIQQNALPNEPLIAFVPISLRQDQSITGNQLSFLLTNLGTHRTLPTERLMTIAKSTQDGKNRFLSMNAPQVINYSLLIYGLAGINLATGLYPKKQAFNLIISNIPGEKQPLYLNGAELMAIYPASVLFDGQALNITFANHKNTIDFGITACDITLPNIDKFSDYLKQALDELYQQLNSQINT